YKKVLLTFTNDTWETIEFYEGSGPYDYITATQGSILYKTSRNKITRLRGNEVLFSDILEYKADFLAIETGENSVWILTREGLFSLGDDQEKYIGMDTPGYLEDI
ncbi:MAG: hypothetical protein JXB48_04745, partial [Candidatus Latescibacteria bacterium]|nr:hypothetical protein [Candidatus Latescibacterota bacterium]